VTHSEVPVLKRTR